LHYQEFPKSCVVLDKIPQPFPQQPNFGQHRTSGRSCVVLYKTTQLPPPVTLALLLSIALYVIRMRGPPLARVVRMSLPPLAAAVYADSSILRVSLQLAIPGLGSSTLLTIGIGTDPLKRLKSGRGKGAAAIGALARVHRAAI
jgi:hypothetical protein